MRIHTIIALLSGFLLTTACQPGGESLAAKQKALLAKKQELRQISQEIAQLEADIAQLDPSAQRDVRQAQVTVQEMQPQSFQHFIEVQGQVEANENILVSPQASGRVTNIYVKEGQSVRAGALLAKIDDAIAQASLKEVETQLELATELFARQQRLWNQGVGTEVQFLEAKNRKESLEKRLATLQEQLSLNRITAPISGTIEEIMPKAGEMVSPGMPAFRIVNNRDLNLVSNLSEMHIPYVKRGDEVIIEFPTLDLELAAKIAVVGQTIHPNDRTFTVEINLPNNALLKPNLFGTLKINDRSLDSALVLPLTLVQQSENGPFVFVAKEVTGEWRAERRELTTGLSYDGKIAVETGLKPGDLLITTGYQDLSDGQVIAFDPTIAGQPSQP